MSLTAKQEQFCQEYLVDANGTQAAIRAGYAESGADVEASRLLVNAKVAARVAELQAERVKRTEITADKVLQRWWSIANADPSELIQLQRVPCRYCHGIDFQYQFTPAEWELEQRQSTKNGITEPRGGIGYDHKKDPNPECPECSGLGMQSVHALDTRKLKGDSKLLYAGVKVSKEGFEIKMQDQAKALESVAKHLGMFIDRTEITGKDGADLQVRVYVPDNGRGSS